MLTDATEKNVKCFASAALAMTVAGLFTAPPAFARIVANTIDARAVVTDNGRHIVVAGPIACTESERAFLRVTVSQRDTGAVAEGSTRITCTGDTQQWEVHASAQNQAAFEEGPATAVALAHTTNRGDITDAHQWLVEITLAGE
ncbi:hypothetical protein [Methylobacter sp. YRD-M1]|uniref:hypothetical protein n=1 Tax=Methylobacter sp. YRD-M1 TaxID=2911520 RepID=UPI00227ACDAF|nr:hypothetical protein [Methylobacter sp. YRD-M1]WAK02286.1 hypothetical protein LZ558_00465 [Methylobacter sp. YRD-M1]